MKIAYKGYEIKPCVNATDRFDLSKTVQRTKKQEDKSAQVETYDAQDDMAFGVDLQRALYLIVVEETIRGFKDETVTISQYMNSFKRHKEELKEFIENKTKIKIN